MWKNNRVKFQKFHLDWPLFLGIFALSLFSLFILYSTKQDIEIVEKQVFRLGLAFVFMMGIAQIPPRFLYRIGPWLYFIGFVLLVAVLCIGQITKGGQRWLDFWVLRFQPAEMMKIAVPLLIARLLSSDILPPRLRNMALPFLCIMIPVLLIAKQPDLSSAIIILSSGLLVFFFAGISWKFILMLVSFIGASCPILWMFLRDYQKQRILTVLNPELDPLGKGYQIIQSKIALGSGGLLGKGWLNGTQSQLEFLPERTTDFIFAVWGEEFGLIGCLILLGLYLCIIIRGLYIGVQAQNTFNRLLSGSIIMTVFVYMFVNIGMVIGILPVAGVPLPFISYGGTSLVTLMANFGILMSIRCHRNLLSN